MFYIIADDLTGANDSGVQLSKKGLNTVVYINPSAVDRDDLSADNSPDVLVLDTETRDLNEKKAGRIIEESIRDLNIKDRDDTLFYKKIDSTLRGNIGKEIEVLMEFLNKDLCILTPSFPRNRRVTAGGYLLVNNEPLGTSQYFNSRLDPGEGSYIPHFVQQQTKLPVALIELKDIIKGEKEILRRLTGLYEREKKIIIPDAVTEQHLYQIMNSSRKFQGSILYCGSAGLANYLVDLVKIKGEKFGEQENDNNSRLTMTVVGTRNKVMEEQIKYFRKKMDVFYLKIDLMRALEDNGKILLDYFKQITGALKEGKHIILHPDPLYKQKRYTDRLLEKGQILFRELEMIIRDFLSRLTAAVINRVEVGNLVLTGGDTAIGVCKELGINSLKIIDELLPGIPLALANDREYNNLKIVTKAGGFGDKDTLYKLIMNLVS